MKESLIQSSIEQYLKILENQNKIIYIKNNSGAVKTGNRFFRFGKAGSPDFFIFLNNGGCLHLEVKNEKGRQSPNQKEYQNKIEHLGHKYIIVRSLDDVMEKLK